MMNTPESVKELLVEAMESYYGRLYSPKQREVLASKFRHKSDAQLVALYDAVIEKLDRLPLLSKILEVDAAVTKRGDFEPVGHTSGSALPWEQRAAQARKDAEGYTTGFMNTHPLARQAMAEGWQYALRQFVDRWAEVQALAALGARNGFGYSPEMLGCPADSEKEQRLQEMVSQIIAARQSGRVDVHVPQWFMIWASKQNQPKKETAHA